MRPLRHRHGIRVGDEDIGKRQLRFTETARGRVTDLYDGALAGTQRVGETVQRDRKAVRGFIVGDGKSFRTPHRGHACDIQVVRRIGERKLNPCHGTILVRIVQTNGNDTGGTYKGITRGGTQKRWCRCANGEYTGRLRTGNRASLGIGYHYLVERQVHRIPGCCARSHAVQHFGDGTSTGHQGVTAQAVYDYFDAVSVCEDRLIN